jgi:hypothetical protein
MACSLAESFLARILFRILEKVKGDGIAPVLPVDYRIAFRWRVV